MKEKLLRPYVGNTTKVTIWRFVRGHQGEAKPEGTIDRYVYVDMRPIPPLLGTMCLTLWLEPTILILTRFLGREYILGRGKALEDITGELAIYLAETDPRWCMHCGDEILKRCAMCNREFGHVCSVQMSGFRPNDHLCTT